MPYQGVGEVFAYAGNTQALLVKDGVFRILYSPPSLSVLPRYTLSVRQSSKNT